MNSFDIDRLVQLLDAAAGCGQGPRIDEDHLDTSLRELGYDSLAVLEFAGRLRQEVGVRLTDEQASVELTPRRILDLVSGSVPSGA